MFSPPLRDGVNERTVTAYHLLRELNVFTQYRGLCSPIASLSQWIFTWGTNGWDCRRVDRADTYLLHVHSQRLCYVAAPLVQ